MKTETIKEHARKLPGKAYGIIVRTIKTATGYIVRLRHDTLEGQVAFAACCPNREAGCKQAIRFALKTNY